MYKKFFAVFMFVIAVYCVVAISQSHRLQAYALDCKEGYVKEGYKCYNHNINLSYDTVDDFYLNDIKCGSRCSLDGSKCWNGVCTKAELSHYGYTEIKDGKFYNPKTKMSYMYDYYTANSGKNFFIDGIGCGLNCDFDGKNCKSGNCNEKEIRENGYTEIKNGKFYNPNTKLSFYFNHFYMDEKECGDGCNFDGTNCNGGFCTEKCVKGFELSDGLCCKDNPMLCYSSQKIFSMTYYVMSGAFDRVDCGIGCDSDGKNCKQGVCHVDDCKPGYKNLSYIKYYTNSPLTSWIPGDAPRRLICHNDAKTRGYDVFKPKKMINLFLMSEVYYYTRK